jgi:hypothetical protein
MRPPARTDAGAGRLHAPTRREHKSRLRAANASLARELVRRTKLTHAQVNAELNRLSGVTRVSEATLQQLQRRLGAAERWIVET